MESNSSTDLVTVGRIAKPHGIAGEVVVVPETDDPDRFVSGARFFFDDGTSTIVSRARRSDTVFLILFEGCCDRNGAEKLRGRRLMIPVSERRSLNEGEFWPDELVGMEVRGPDGVDLGVVEEVIEGLAQYRLVIKSADSRFQVPFVDELVPEVDMESGYLVVVPIEGLTDPM